MAYNHEYPYVDPNRFNSDWLLNKVKELEGEMDTFEALNSITFSGEWDITKQYPAWTVVNDNNGRDGYISIQPVPAGVTIDNTDYWRSVANYSDIIAGLQNRVVQLESDVADLESDKADKLKNKKILLVSDSYGNLRNAQNKTYVDLACAHLGLNNVTHLQVGGSGFIGYQLDPTLAWEYILDNYSGDDPASFTDVYLVGGANDIPRSQADIEAAMASFMVMFKQKYVNAECHIVDFGITWTYTSFADRTDKQLPAYHNAAKYGMSYCSGAEYTLNDNTFFSGDPTHCNASGVDAMGDALAQAFLNNYVNVHRHGLFTPQWLAWSTWDMTQLSPTVNNIYHTLKNGTEEFIVTGAGALAAISFSARTVPTRGNFSNCFYFPEVYSVASRRNFPTVQGELILVDNGGTVTSIPIRLYQTSEDASTYGSLYGVSMYGPASVSNVVQMYIMIPPFSRDC